MRILTVSLVALLASVMPAFAADGGTVGAVLSALVGVLGVVLATALSTAALFFAKKLGLERRSQAYSIIEDTIQNGIMLAAKHVSERVHDFDYEFESDVLDETLGYVTEQVARELREAGMNDDALESWTRSTMAWLLPSIVPDPDGGGDGTEQSVNYAEDDDYIEPPEMKAAA